MSDRNYFGRLNRRDQRHPEKRGQERYTPDDFLKGYDAWDVVLDAYAGVNTVVDRLIWRTFGVPSLEMRRNENLSGDQVLQVLKDHNIYAPE